MTIPFKRVGQNYTDAPGSREMVLSKDQAVAPNIESWDTERVGMIHMEKTREMSVQNILKGAVRRRNGD